MVHDGVPTTLLESSCERYPILQPGVASRVLILPLLPETQILVPAYLVGVLVVRGCLDSQTLRHSDAPCPEMKERDERRERCVGPQGTCLFAVHNGP